MVAIPLPPCDAATLKRRLYDDHAIEVPVFDWHDRQILRVSAQAYNTKEDVDQLLGALPELL